MKKLNNHRKHIYECSLHLAGMAVVAAVIGLFYVLVHQPLQRRQAVYETRTAQLAQLQKASLPEVQAYRELRAKLTSMKASIFEVREKLASEAELETLVDEVTNLALEVDVQLISSEIGSTKQLATHSQTEVEFQCRGSYDSICQFLHRAEKLTKIAKISGFELQSSINPGGYPLQLTFVLYSGGVSNDISKKRGVL